MGRIDDAPGVGPRRRRLRQHGESMIERYTRPEMARIWSEETRLGHWLEIELGLVDVLAERGTVPREAAKNLRAGAKVNVRRMQEIEAEVKHDVIAFVSSVAEGVGDEGQIGR